MKLYNYLIAGVSLMALGACSDFLEVDAPSKSTLDYVFSDKSEMNQALNGVYAALLSDNTYGKALLASYQLNSDVEFKSSTSEIPGSSNYYRFDCDAQGGQKSAWAQFYSTIERANIFVDKALQSELMASETDAADIYQMVGEAKVIRSMCYHDLTWMFGDVPFTFAPSYGNDDLIYDVVDRTEMLQALIDDLIEAAPKMKLASELTDGTQRIGKDMAWAMIARLAMTAGGYSLRPDGNTYGKMERPANYRDFYKTAADYCDSVITYGGHSLTKDYYQVFVDECNFKLDAGNDDVIFEIPFAKEGSGNIGYIHGPKMDSSDGQTVHNYGKANSDAALSSFYRFFFDENDQRRDYLNQMWYYTASDNVATISNGYVVYNGKWSKLWVDGGLGSGTEAATGINYPYMRYADVLLMHAEALNEINDGPTAEAMNSLETVRERAFRRTPAKITDYPKGSKEEFLKAVLDERKFEFAGENMRWRDLVRNNLYNECIYWSFFRYYAVAEDGGSSSDYLDYVATYDKGDDMGWSRLPRAIYYNNNVANNGLYTMEQFPNSQVKVVEIFNPYEYMSSTDAALIPTKSKADFFDWFDEGTGMPKAQCQFSFYGYIRPDGLNSTRLVIIKDGVAQTCPHPSTYPTAATLPVVRYLLPYPATVVSRSHGKYVQHYGY